MPSQNTTNKKITNEIVFNSHMWLHGDSQGWRGNAGRGGDGKEKVVIAQILAGGGLMPGGRCQTCFSGAQ